MKQLASVARNLEITIDEDGEKFTRRAEIVLHLVENGGMIGQSGSVEHHFEVEAVRFHATEAGLRNLAKHLIEYADQVAAIPLPETEAKQ